MRSADLNEIEVTILEFVFSVYQLCSEVVEMRAFCIPAVSGILYSLYNVLNPSDMAIGSTDE